MRSDKQNECSEKYKSSGQVRSGTEESFKHKVVLLFMKTTNVCYLEFKCNSNCLWGSKHSKIFSVVIQPTPRRQDYLRKYVGDNLWMTVRRPSSCFWTLPIFCLFALALNIVLYYFLKNSQLNGWSCILIAKGNGRRLSLNRNGTLATYNEKTRQTE